MRSSFGYRSFADWQGTVIEADYSTALTILLRYPPTSPQYPAVTFVHDAVYLRENLSSTGGIHLITKYSKRAPRSDKERQPRKALKAGKRPESRERGRSSRVRPPLGSPARYIRQYGIEAVLQDAAKAMYTRGEKWGVNQVVRDAVDEVKRNVQGLQSAGTSPRPQGETSRWSLDQGRQVFEEPTGLLESEVVQQLQRRNKDLADRLEAVEKDLQKLRQTTTKDLAAPVSAEILDSATLKLQLVRSCLEDPSITIPPEENGERATSMVSSKSLPVTPEKKSSAEVTSSTEAPNRTSPPAPIHQIISTDGPAAEAVEDPTVASLESLPSDPFGSTANRPSLEESPFAWMLGDEEVRSQFKASFPSPATERRRSKNGAKAGYLFGNTTNEGTVGREGDNEELEYDLGSMRGRKGGV